MFARIDKDTESRIVLGAIMSLQSLFVLGMQYGAKANSIPPVGGSVSNSMNSEINGVIVKWDASCTKKLKSEGNRIPAMNLLSEMKRKRSPQGAYDLLVSLGIWQADEDLGLLRSGFQLRFDDSEIQSAKEACSNMHDVDELLNIREDLSFQKVYTIDSASTTEIDDGLSVEKFTKDDGSNGKRFWIHIADGERWAPPGSRVFDIAKQRATSLYLPQGSIPMIPEILCTEKMSLNANAEKCSLSLGVELAPDGSVIDSSIRMTASTIKVSYRLTYDDVDEMLEDGIAYNEEWELGELFAAAKTRRDYRIRNGSAEAFVPTQIPQYSISTYTDDVSHDNVGIALNIQVSHNGGKNQSMVDCHDKSATMTYATPVSAASMLVTEMMILAGEAVGRWKMWERKQNSHGCSQDHLRHLLRIPFRTQPSPDYRSRMREKSIMEDLLNNDTGGGLCHAWYARRFFSPAEIREVPSPHSGLGIECYTQWSSPIRRFGDLQVHATIKRYLRRKRMMEMKLNGSTIPSNITFNDIGCDPELFATEATLPLLNMTDTDIDFTHGLASLKAARVVQRSSQTYWMLEFIRRIDRSKTFEAVILGCRNPSRKQYMIYIHELGLEWQYTSPVDNLTSGTRMVVKATNILPRNGQMTLVRVHF
ncbi:unnamed protein product [Cylindrotheca closterium]|uniref:DIS3-like exonuclease 1 n=1 Tax=Cylindrotheca closterium TaxID=2856 RepID=A0AAD2G4F2_9STRA|nr:unnamed protein product [Cylindrotheca closterium]